MSWLNRLTLDEDLKTFMKQIMTQIEEEVPSNKYVSAVTFMGLLEDFSVIPVNLDISNGSKKAMDEALRKLIRKMEPDFAVTVFETQFMRVQSISDLLKPIKQHGVMMLVETRFESFTILGEISDDRQRIEWQPKNTEDLKGLFTNLLPKDILH